MGLFGKTVIKRPALRKLYVPLMHLSMLSPRGGGRGEGDPSRCGVFDFSEEFLVKIPTVGPQILGQIRSNIPTLGK